MISSIDMLTPEAFEIARTLVEDVVRRDHGRPQLYEALVWATVKVPPDLHREFYIHVSTLLLNVLLNRIGELGLVAEGRATTGRQAIREIIRRLDMGDYQDDRELRLVPRLPFQQDYWF